MGNTKKALHLITHDLRDVKRAIDFCKEHHDEELWDDLIMFSIDKPCKYFVELARVNGCESECACACDYFIM